jgi:hypothetical protein
MEFYKFFILTVIAIATMRTVLANWMAQNRPVEGQEFHWTDGFWDLVKIIIYSLGAHFLLGL